MYFRQLRQRSLPDLYQVSTSTSPGTVIEMGHRKNGPGGILTVVMASDRSEMGDDE